MSKKQSGAGMIEVLVALVVLSLGILGLAGLQTMGLKFNTQSYQRTQAIMLTYDIVDRMRANRLGRDAALYDNIGWGAPPACGGCQGLAANCPSAVQATCDVAEWKQSLLVNLGGGADGRIRTIPDAASLTMLHEITIRWSENEISQTVVTEVEL